MPSLCYSWLLLSAAKRFILLSPLSLSLSSFSSSLPWSTSSFHLVINLAILQLAQMCRHRHRWWLRLSIQLNGQCKVVCVCLCLAWVAIFGSARPNKFGTITRRHKHTDVLMHHFAFCHNHPSSSNGNGMEWGRLN